MALNGSGPISLGGSTTGQSIAVELGLSPTASISLNQTNVRTLAGVASGTIVMPTNFWGKSNAYVVNVTISSDTADYNMKNAAISAGWNQTDVLNMTVTINSGIYVYSSSTSTAALVTGSTFPTGTVLNIVNNGLIVGKGGNGGNGGAPITGNGTAGSSGGPALTASAALRITNNNTIGGGGGGGGGGAGWGFDGKGNSNGGGAGGGGGRGISNGGSPGASGVNGTGTAGGNGTLSAAGNGGSGVSGYGFPTGNGGNGGSLGASGSNGQSTTNNPSPLSGGAGGSGGNCTTSGSNANITWVVNGNRFGTLG